jgi:hypothetical protein
MEWYMKKCFKCGIKKRLSNFYRHPKMKDGHVNKCKECNKRDVVNNRKKNINYYLAYDKLRANLPHRVKLRNNYQKTEAGKISIKKSHKKWIENNPEKRAAHVLLNNALRSGKIKKEKCKKCGDEKSHGHHYDYCKPLNVMWLCRRCHDILHK